VPSITLIPTSSSAPSINPSVSSRPSISPSLTPSINPSASSRPSISSSSTPSTSPSSTRSLIRPIPNTPFYVDADKKSSWEDCKSAIENNGFTFASIQNQAENDAVADYLQSNDIQRVWLGGYQTSDEDWAWLDETSWTSSTYTNWHSSQPDNRNNDEHSLRLRSRDGTWFDDDKVSTYPCLFRDLPSSSAPTAASLNIETLAATVLAFFESIVTFFNNLLPF